MEPIVTHRLDPAVRSTEKRDGDSNPPPRRRRPAPRAKPAAPDETIEPETHQLDDLA